MRWIVVAVVIASFTSVGRSEAQLGGNLRIEPFIGYGFFGELADTEAELEADLSYGGRVAFQLAPQWALFATGQRSTPAVTGGVSGIEIDGGEVTVDHWSGGVEFSYAPRGGAEGILPIVLEAGLGQTRYRGGPNDLAVNVGIASALRLSPNFSIRYGVNDYISNYADERGVVNHIFAHVGAEFGL